MGAALSTCEDAEGRLVRLPGAALRWSKQLPTDVAWHVGAPEDLADLASDQVSSVAVDFCGGCIEIGYQPGLEPLGLERLRALTAPAEEHGAWRLATLARQLAVHLEELHRAALPQGFVHPWRVALGPVGFVLLPTLAGTLPAPIGLRDQPVPDWLTYADPEVLRTRADQVERLSAGEVYGLGMLVCRLAFPDWTPARAPTALALLEQLVEQGVEPAPAWAASFADLGALVDRMIRPHGASRPAIGALVADLSALCERLDPLRRARMALEAGDVEGALRAVTALEAHAGCAAFARPPAVLLAQRAAIELARSPAEFPRALDYLRRALQEEPLDPDLHRAVGRAYARFDGHPQRWLLAAEAYEKAAQLAGWQMAVLGEWFAALTALGDPMETFKQTMGVPFERRDAPIHAHWVRALLAQRQPRAAWDYCARWLEHRPREPLGLAAARQVAALLETVDLVRWLHQEVTAEQTPDVLQGVVWERAGDSKRALMHFARAGVAGHPPRAQE